MKKLNLLILALALGVMTAFSSCNKDDDMDPNVFCDENVCVDNKAKKEQCIDAFNECMESEPDANDDECAATALIICRI